MKVNRCTRRWRDGSEYEGRLEMKDMADAPDEDNDDYLDDLSNIGITILQSYRDE